MSGTEKGFEKTAATVLETKSPNCLAMLAINFSINWKYLKSCCFYFRQNDSVNDYRKFVLNGVFENIILFLKRVNSSDQIKSSTSSSLLFYIQVFEVLHHVSQSLSFLENAENTSGFLHILLTSREKTRFHFWRTNICKTIPLLNHPSWLCIAY